MLPALLGLVWGLLRRGSSRRVGLIGVAALGACAAHATLLAVWSAGTGAPTGEDFYLIASVSFWITGLALGTWCLLDGMVALVRALAFRLGPHARAAN